MAQARGERRRRLRRRWRLSTGGFVTLGVCGASATMVLLALVWRSQPAAPLRGQVLASVGSSEVTNLDLEAESHAEGRVYAPADQGRYLDVVVSRLLLAKAAQVRGLDRTPIFPAERARAQAQVLADELVRQIAPPREPKSQDVSAYISAHTDVFAGRRAFVVDRLRWAEPTGQTRSVSDLGSLTHTLQGLGIPFQADRVTILSDALAPEVTRRLMEGEPGHLVTINEGASHTALAMVTAQSDPHVGTDAITEARSLLMRDQQRSIVSKMVEDLKRRAQIRYQDGYGPSVIRARGESR